MNSDAIAAFIGAFIASGVATPVIARYAAHFGLIDLPDARRSHRSPTPRGGGIAIVLTVLGGLQLTSGLAIAPSPVSGVVLVGGLIVAMVSMLEDYRGLPRKLRFTAHVIAATWVVYALPGPPLGVAHLAPIIQMSFYLVEIIGLVWLINLYNFMDGIDGLAASETIFVALAAVALLVARSSLVVPLCLLAGSAAGFLPWNWSPARIFMGDSGSCFVGFTLGTLALASIRQELLPIAVWPTLLGVFLVDATVTLTRRMVSGARWYQPHRSHGYQRLSRRWASHTRVTVAVLGLDVVWLLPCAVLTVAFPTDAWWLAMLALAPILALAMALGAGRTDSEMA